MPKVVDIASHLSEGNIRTDLLVRFSAAQQAYGPELGVLVFARECLVSGYAECVTGSSLGEFSEKIAPLMVDEC